MTNLKHLSKYSITFGHVIECFDNTLYGFYAVMLAPIFFPSVDPAVSILQSYGAFFVGYLARPIGALLFGHLGDVNGRRKPLIMSMALVGIPTASIGFLPSYEQIGILSPLLLIICRFTQGFFMGGEFAGANLYMVEDNAPQHMGAKTGKLISFGVIGAIFATLSGAFFTMESLPEWAWRIPFLMGGVAAFLTYLFRRSLPETEIFTYKKPGNPSNSSWAIIFTFYWKELLVSILLAGLTVIPLYSASILGNKLFKELGYSHSQSMLINTFDYTVNAVVIYLSGRMADRVGFRKHLLVGIGLTVILVFPAYSLISGPVVSIFHILPFITILVVSGAIINGCGVAYVASFFPTQCRYSALAASFTIGWALLGGTTPMIGAYLINKLGTNYAPAIYISIVAIIAFIGLYKIKNKNYLGANIEGGL